MHLVSLRDHSNYTFMVKLTGLSSNSNSESSPESQLLAFHNPIVIKRTIHRRSSCGKHSESKNLCRTKRSVNIHVNLLKLCFVVLKRTDCVLEACRREKSLTSESIEGASLPLEGIDHIHGGDGFPLGVLSVGDGISDDILEENLIKINLYQNGQLPQLGGSMS